MTLAVLLYALPATAGVLDEWSDEGSDGSFSSQSKIDSSFSDSTGSDGSQITEERTTVTDADGARSEYATRETRHPDGTVTREQDVSYTDQFGNKRSDQSTAAYDAQGNLLEETHTESSGTTQPGTGGEGVQTTDVIDPGQPGSYTQTTTFGGDTIKVETSTSPGTELIFDLLHETAKLIDKNTGKITPMDMYLCKDFADSMKAQYGTQSNAANQMLDTSSQVMAQLGQMPGFQQRAAQGLQEIEKLKGTSRELDRVDPERFTYSPTRERRVIAGLLAEKVIVKDGANIVQVLWLSSSINVLGRMDFPRIPQKAKDYFFASAKPSPVSRRLLSRLKLAEFTKTPTGKKVRITKSVKSGLRPLK
jgi:YD repeat-containing protein